jgi:hypothetical protein
MARRVMQSLEQKDTTPIGRYRIKVKIPLHCKHLRECAFLSIDERKGGHGTALS